MAEYKTKKIIEELSGINLIQKLIINGRCQFDEFIEGIKRSGTYINELNQIFAHLGDLGKNSLIPYNKFKDLKKDKKVKIKDYELKTKHQRVNLVRDKANDRLIIFAGKKTNQKKDIKLMRKIKIDII